MDPGPLIERILNDEGLTGDLSESAAETLNTWLINRAKEIARAARTNAEANRQLEAICRKVRGLAEKLAANREADESEILAGLLKQLDESGRDA